jgi:transcriptional regulator with XRE-family HTH domain
VVTTSFGEALRYWRARRRLSQAQLAGDIATPSRHISFLETGRATPSRDMIRRLCQALDIPLREQNALYRAAGLADAFPVTPLESREASQLRAMLKRLLNSHDPAPALMIDRQWRVRDVNQGARAILAPFAARFPLLEAEPSLTILDLIFSPDGLRPVIQNWPDYARYTIQRLHRESLTPDDLAAALARLRHYPDVPGNWWSFDGDYTVEASFPLRLHLGGAALTFTSMIASVSVPTDALAQELRAELHFPADAATEAALTPLTVP